MASTEQRVQARPSDGSGALSSFVKGTTSFAKKHKTITFSYVLGIALLLFGTGFRVSEEARNRYDDILDSIDTEAIQKSYYQYAEADQAYRNSQGWFWSCNSNCQTWKAQMEQRRDRFYALKKIEESKMSEARQQVGIFSEYGVQEARDRFWSAFQGGREFAQRQSMWDMFFAGLAWRRDDTLFSVIFRFLFNVLINFTLGVIGAFVAFVYRVFALISAYRPDPVTAIAFAALSILR